MRTVWIDLTDIQQWSGNHGGTQRVVYGIAKNYFLEKEKLDYSVRFFDYSSTEQAFYETSFEPVYNRVENTTKANNEVPLARHRKLKNALRRLVPAQIRSNRHVRKTVSKARLEVSKRGHSIYKRLKAQQQPVNKSNDQALQFKEQDTVLMLGKPWDDLGIQKLLSQQKQQHNFYLAQVVYDLIIPLYPHLHHPSLFKQYTQHMFEAVAASDLLLAISKSSATDLKEFSRRLNLPLPKVKVIRLGDDIIANESNEKPDPRINDSFLACIGTIEIRKNHMFLYYVYKLAAQKGMHLPQMAIVGSRGWLSGDFQYLIENDPDIQDNIILLDNISDSGLNWIYKNCLFTIYPSMYEGWGLPIAESLNYGKMCIASTASSIPEIAGDLIDYFSPYNPEDCLRVINRYLNPDQLSQKEKSIRANYTSTSWHDTFMRVESLLDAKELLRQDT